MNIFTKRSKITVADIISGGYTDLHSHLLPGCDDGTKDYYEAVMLFNLLAGFGFDQFVVTPHIRNDLYNNTEQSIRFLHAEFMSVLNLGKSNFKCYPAAEYYIDSSFLKLLRPNYFLTLPSRHLLVETSLVAAPLNITNIAYDIIECGYVPVFAHPERYSYFSGEVEVFKKLKALGCKFQLNLLSLVGYYGKKSFLQAEYLLDNDWFDFTGSDIHNVKHAMALNNVVIYRNAGKIQRLNENNASLF